jgi:hypothetical protein
MKKTTLSRNERADDIARLKADLNLSDLHYVDISAQLELSQALKRWPLLVELMRPLEPLSDEVVTQDDRSTIREARQ